MGSGGFEPPALGISAPLRTTYRYRSDGRVVTVQWLGPYMTRNFSPKKAVDRYLRERESELSDRTIRNHQSLLEYFVEFCREREIETMSEIDPFFVSDFRLKREEEVSDPTVYNNLSTLRTFIRWCEHKGLIEETIADNMALPDVSGSARITTIDPNRAEEILIYLKTYEYATLKHALFALLWDTGIRIGAARSLNVDNFDGEEKYISLEHNPDEDTPLKNGEQSEREINLNSWCSEIIEDYIEARRTQVTDEFGNKPLFSTDHGRAHQTTLAKHVVALTRPCYYSNECPHDREIKECKANSYDHAAKCPSSVSPHPIRRSAITYWLNEGYSKELLSDRMDVSGEVLEKHYDARTEEEKRALRRDMLDIE